MFRHIIESSAVPIIIDFVGKGLRSYRVYIIFLDLVVVMSQASLILIIIDSLLPTSSWQSELGFIADIDYKAATQAIRGGFRNFDDIDRLPV